MKTQISVVSARAILLAVVSLVPQVASAHDKA
jgi:hypothetical protein